MARGYQYDFSSSSPYVFERENRERKAWTMRAVLEDYLDGPISDCSVLNVGGSAGVIDNYLADYVARVVGVDIDTKAIEHATTTYSKPNLEFRVADALDLPFDDASFDVVVCSQVYEHVPDPAQMFREIRRVLKPGGVCYFAAGNRLMWNEPHYNLPLLSVLPRPLAHVYIRLAGKADHYYEKHLSYWGLKNLVADFSLVDYTRKLISEPDRFHTSYMVPPGSTKSKVAQLMARSMYWALPGYVWLLRRS